MPVPKPGKDHTEPTGCRPVALAGCLCGALGGVVGTWLVWCLKSGDLMSPVQSGFRSERGANDSLIRLEASFVEGGHVVAVFFDFGRSCDAAWRCGVMRGLRVWDWGIDCRFLWGGFLADRCVRVRVGSTVWAGTGYSTGQHSLYHTVQYQNEQHCKLFGSEDRGFIVR